jgi:hypothetical protein
MGGEDDVLAKAKELDGMTRSVTSGEADVLNRVLEAYNDGKQPRQKDAERVRAMYDKYLGKREDDSEAVLDSADRLGEEFIDDAEDDLDMLQ